MRINTRRYEIGSRHWCVGSRNVASSHKLYIICSEWVVSFAVEFCVNVNTVHVLCCCMWLEFATYVPIIYETRML